MALGRQARVEKSAYAVHPPALWGQAPELEPYVNRSGIRVLRTANSDGLPATKGLEFLGDSVLDMIVVDMLFRKFPNDDEGEMTRMKARLVSREALNFLGEEIGVEHLLDAQTGKGAVHASLRGNAMEALVGAVYLDRGFRRTQRAVLKLLKRFDLDTRIQATVDFKSKLHEWGQKRKRKVQFNVMREFKRDGQQLYQMQVLVGGQGDGHFRWPIQKVGRAGCGPRGLSSYLRRRLGLQLERVPAHAHCPTRHRG